MIDVRLKAQAIESPAHEHLDEDAICAFVEGRLEETESVTVVAHLIACAACRQTTAQLVRFESQFDAEDTPVTSDASSGRLRPFLDRLAASLTPSLEEDAVFAYYEPAEKIDQDAAPNKDSQPEKTEDRD
jgi:anti-sigma factor RsiW